MNIIQNSTDINLSPIAMDNHQAFITNDEFDLFCQEEEAVNSENK